MRRGREHKMEPLDKASWRPPLRGQALPKDPRFLICSMAWVKNECIPHRIARERRYGGRLRPKRSKSVDADAGLTTLIMAQSALTRQMTWPLLLQIPSGNVDPSNRRQAWNDAERVGFAERNKMNMPPELRSLLDREEIKSVVYRVCRAMDRADLELFRSCYHDDAWDDHGYFKGPISEFKPQSIFRPPHVKNLMHLIGNILIDLEGDRAVVESYYLARQRVAADDSEKDMQFGGRYLDRFERRAGVWKISHRTAIYDWNRIDPVNETMTMPGGVLGYASKEDLSYEYMPTESN
jgi:hypothetical protein